MGKKSNFFRMIFGIPPKPVTSGAAWEARYVSGDPIQAKLYPEHYSERTRFMRELGSIRWIWCKIKIINDESGDRIIQFWSDDDFFVGFLAESRRDEAEDFWNSVLEYAPNVCTVRITDDSLRGGDVSAEACLGDHQYVPRMPWTVHSS